MSEADIEDGEETLDVETLITPFIFETEKE